MARPDFARSTDDLHTAHHAGGTVAAMHQAIEAKMILTKTTLPEWTAYGDLHSPADDALHLFSRATGIAALGLGAALSVAIVAHLF